MLVLALCSDIDAEQSEATQHGLPNVMHGSSSSNNTTTNNHDNATTSNSTNSNATTNSTIINNTTLRGAVLLPGLVGRPVHGDLTGSLEVRLAASACGYIYIYIYI